MRRIIPITLLLCIVFLLNTSSVSARHRGKILGISTSASEVTFPPVTAGTGFILPDSPFYFLDKVKQETRLFFAFSSADKAKIRKDIANERLAELRVMFSRNNQKGINTALNELSNETRMSAHELSDATSQGKDVSKLAQEINDSVKNEREVLQSLEKQTDGALKLRLQLAKISIKNAKTEVEDNLPDDIFDNEIQDSINDDLEEGVDDALDSSKRIKESLEELKKEASESGRKALSRREEALKKALEEKNKDLEKEEENTLKQEENKQKNLLKATSEAADAAEKASEAAKKAAEAFTKSQKKIEKLRAIPIPFPIPTPTPQRNKVDSEKSGSETED